MAEVGGHLVVVLVSAADRRMVTALSFLPRLSDATAVALHVAVDDAHATQLAHDWMALGIGWLPLQIEDANGGTVAAGVRAVVAAEAARRSSVTVLVPEMDLGRWWQPMLHRGTGREVAWHLHDLPDVRTAILPVRVDLDAQDGPDRAAQR